MITNDNYKHSELTGKIMKAYFNVYNALGYGFLEKVYENAMMIELKKMGLDCEKQVSIDVFYETEHVGNYYADIVVNQKVIIELKASEYLAAEHECQLVNYLRATKIEVGLLLNFGSEPQSKRKVLSNQFKKHILS